MKTNISILAVITARGGSKGIPKKNISSLGGKPLIQYTVEALNDSKRVNHVMLSSDDPEIISVCESLGVHSPYQRPAHLATDESSSLDALRHAVTWWCDYHQTKPDAVMLLQPTSPFRTSQHVDDAVCLYEQEASSSLIGVKPLKEHPAKCIEQYEKGWAFLRKSQATRRQDYDERYYVINGAMYLVSYEHLFEKTTLCIEGQTTLFQMSEEESLDIDDPIDLVYAEALLHAQQSGLI